MKIEGKEMKTTNRKVELRQHFQRTIMEIYIFENNLRITARWRRRVKEIFQHFIYFITISVYTTVY